MLECRNFICVQRIWKKHIKKKGRGCFGIEKHLGPILLKKKNHSFSAKACTRLGEQGKEENAGHFLIELGP